MITSFHAVLLFSKKKLFANPTNGPASLPCPTGNVIVLLIIIRIPLTHVLEMYYFLHLILGESNETFQLILGQEKGDEGIR